MDRSSVSEADVEYCVAQSLDASNKTKQPNSAHAVLLAAACGSNPSLGGPESLEGPIRVGYGALRRPAKRVAELDQAVSRT